MTSQSHTSPLREPNPKRRKVAIACEPCRGRKARCDGSKPVCGACATRSQQCIYKVSSGDAAHTIEYVESLVKRIAQLEQELNRMRSSLGTEANPSATQNHQNHLNHLHDQDRPRRESIPQNHGIIPTVSSPVDAMGANAGPEESPGANNKFYGPSSALSFTRQMYSAILHKDAIPSLNGPGTEPSCHPARDLSVASDIAPENFSLLPRHLTDNLISLYWTRVHVLYPFLHKESFNRAYEDLWKPAASHHTPHKPELGLGASIETGPSSVVFHCAFNAVLALGLQFSSLSIAEKDRLSDILIQKSQNLLKLDLFADGSLALVQTLLLQTQYWQSTSCPNKCWTTMGVACRLAQGLGLHLQEGRFLHHMDPLEKEVRRRVWHGCVILDIAVSMTLGRPAMLIGDSSQSLPGPVDSNDWISNPGAEGTSIIAFFAEAIKLSRIIGRILLRIYKLNEAQNEKVDLPDGCTSFDVLVEFDEELSQFARRLPSFLSWTQSELQTRTVLDPASILLRQSHVLHVRFLHARLLLYRPVLFYYCRHNSIGQRTPRYEEAASNTIASPFAFHSALACVTTARDLIKAVKEYSGTEATGAWWYNMFYIRIAAMVVLLAGICPSIYESVGSEAWNSAWADCQRTLMYNLPQSSSVKTCLASLEALRNHVLRHRNLAEMDPSLGDSNRSAQPTAPGSPQATHNHHPGQNRNIGDEAGGIPSTPMGHMLHAGLDDVFDPIYFLEAGLFSDPAFNSINPFP